MEQQGYISNNNLINAGAGKAYSTALYMRFSKDDGQLGDSSSIETQRLLLERYCRDNGYTIFDRYVDDGFSGLNFERPDFKRMLKDIEDGKINLVITKDQSRLGRDYIQTGYITEVVFGDHNVRYIAINDGADTANPANSDFMPFRNIINNLYSKDLSRKVKSAKRQRALSGTSIRSTAPYGYKQDPNAKHKFVVDDEAAAVVREIFRLALEGKGKTLIAKILTERQVLTPSAYKTMLGYKGYRHVGLGKSKECDTFWRFSTVKFILRNRNYVGDMVNHRFETVNYKTGKQIAVPKEQHIVIKDTHEPLVSRDDFERIQQISEVRHRNLKRHSFENIFRGLLTCTCGKRMRLSYQVIKTAGNGRKIKPQYRCQRGYVNPGESSHYNSINYDNIYEQVLQSVKRVLALMKDDETVLELVQRKTGDKSDRKKLLSEKAKLQKRQDGLMAIIRRLYEDNLAGALSEKNYLDLLQGYQAEQKILIARLNAIDDGLDKSEDYTEQLNKLRALARSYSECNTLTAEMLNQLVERIELGLPQHLGRKVIKQEITIIYRFINSNI